MSAYIIVDIDIHDSTQYDQYRQLVSPTLTAYDGKFLVRGGAAETLEGDWRPRRIVVLEFPSTANAKAWWDSPEYSAARAIRQRAAHTRMIVVEGAR
jgi:uncharacterized protein (DUF1330 family)